MFRVILFAVAAVGLLAASPALAEDYTLKLYKSKKGDKTEHENTEKTVTTVKLSNAGVDKKDEIPSGKKETFTEEILEKKDGDKKATKLTRTYTVAEKTAKGMTVKESVSGKTVLIEKKGDKYELSVAGKALTESDAPDLFRKFNKKDDGPQNDDLLPTEPVKVGGSWKLPADKTEKLIKSLGEDKMKFDPKKSLIEGKLLKAYKKDGAQFGVLEFTITVSLTDIDLNGQMFKTSADSKLVMKGTIDTCIDGTVEFEDGKMEVALDVVTEIPNAGTLTLSVKTTGVEKARAKK